MITPLTQVWLTEDEARLFVMFQKHYQTIAPIVGYLESLKLMDLGSTNITIDIDPVGVVRHTSITKNFKL